MCGDSLYSDLFLKQMECELEGTAAACSAARQCSWSTNGTALYDGTIVYECTVNAEVVLGEAYPILNEAEEACTSVLSESECNGNCEMSDGGCALSAAFSMGILLGQDVQDVPSPFIDMITANAVSVVHHARTPTHAEGCVGTRKSSTACPHYHQVCQAHNESACGPVGTCTWDEDEKCTVDEEVSASAMAPYNLTLQMCRDKKLQSACESSSDCKWDDDDSECGMSPDKEVILMLCGDGSAETVKEEASDAQPATGPSAIVVVVLALTSTFVIALGC